jgi:hypothetical protein
MGETRTSAAPRILILLSALAGAACGDAALCDSTPLIAIQSPTAGVTVDGDAAAPGVQSDVRVRSTLVDGDELVLEVLDSDGTVVVTQRKPAGEGGETVFAGVTLPVPKAKLRASWQGACGSESDEVEIDVVAGTGCDVKLSPTPVPMPAYPVGVLNRQSQEIESMPTPGFQAQVEVATRAGWQVQLYATAGGGAEQPAGEATMADAMGLAKYEQTLLDGPIAFRAVCRGPGNQIQPSASVSAFVDRTEPTCDFTSPLPGTTITPSYDLDPIEDGVQLAFEAFVGGGDVVGQGVDLEVFSEEDGTTIVPMMPVDPQGRTTAMLTLEEYVYELKILTTDRAGNSCVSPQSYEVEYNGCSIRVTGPTAAVKVDADGIPGNGSQLDVQLAVDAACVGRMVTSTCGLNNPQGVVPSGGVVALRVTMCGTSPCETQPTSCRFTVSTPANVQTRAAALITFDNVSPPVDLQLVQPAVSCGAEIMPVDDIDPAIAGVQVVARVTSAGGLGHSLLLDNSMGKITVATPTDKVITLAPGFNQLTGIAYDVHGNRGTTTPCPISLATPAVTARAPAAPRARPSTSRVRPGDRRVP